MLKQDFIKQVNATRLKNKNKWFYITETVENRPVYIKCYNTYLQIFRISGINKASGLMEQSVKDFNQELNGNIPGGYND